MGNRQLQPPDAAEFAERLNLVLDGVKGVPPRGKRGEWLGGLYKVSKASGGDWLRGKNMPESWRVLDMAERWKVPFMWLYFGRGRMNDSVIATAGEEGSHSRHESLPSSLAVRIDTLSIAIEVAAEALSDERPTPTQQARYAALCYALLEDGMARAEVLQFARRAAILVSGGISGSTTGGTGA